MGPFSTLNYALVISLLFRLTSSSLLTPDEQQPLSNPFKRRGASLDDDDGDDLDDQPQKILKKPAASAGLFKHLYHDTSILHLHQKRQFHHVNEPIVQSSHTVSLKQIPPDTITAGSAFIPATTTLNNAKLFANPHRLQRLTTTTTTTSSTPGTGSFFQNRPLFPASPSRRPPPPPASPSSSDLSRNQHVTTSLFSSTTTSTSTTTTTTTTTPARFLEAVDLTDPCHEQNHAVIPNEPQRSFNHGLTLKLGALPVCDRHLVPGWYRFDSPAGNLMPTECPGDNSCGTHMPIWLKGEHPSASQGIVSATGCINRDRECCFDELPIQIKNCSASGVMIYHLGPTPACNMGYCAGYGLPCPKGLSSPSGFTPCDFVTEVIDVTLNVDESFDRTKVLLRCRPTMQNVTDPATVVINVEWFVDGGLVLQESFSLAAKISATLDPELWSPGQTIRCTAAAHHSSADAGWTDRKSSQPFSTGLQVLPESDTEILEGSRSGTLYIRSTIPMVCGHSFSDCCSRFRVLVSPSSPSVLTTKNESLSEACFPSSKAIRRISVGLRSNQCMVQICRSNWKQTFSISVTAKAHRSNPTNSQQQLVSISLLPLEDTGLWRKVTLAATHTIRLLPADVSELCVISTPTSQVTTFDGVTYKQDKPGTYVLYRHQELPYEVQGHFRGCTLRKNCLCALAIRSNEVVVYFDICSKGHLQTWATQIESGKSPTPASSPPDINVISRNEGRNYEINLASGAQLILDALLTEVKVLVSTPDWNQTVGLCGTFDRNPANEFVDSLEPASKILCPSEKTGCDLFLASWTVDPQKTLFNNPTALNRSSSNPDISGSADQCSCTGTHPENLGSEFLVCDRGLDVLDGKIESCSTDKSILDQLITLGSNLDYDGSARLYFDSDNELDITSPRLRLPQPRTPDDRVAEITLPTDSSGKSELNEGWSSAAAETFCVDFLKRSSSFDRCQWLPEIDVSSFVRDCREDLMFAQDTRVALIHLGRMKSACRNSLFRNSTMLSMDQSKPFALTDIAGSLCPNDCSGEGVCRMGQCECHPNRMGGDCAASFGAGPRVALLANFGLCDVRTKPCRDLVVLGENFADASNLQCVFEVFKVRGVASKQLVKDAILTVPAVFLSHEQIICRLPFLDIHDPEDVSKFDLGDNTDHTRIFVKLYLAYGEGPRSSPLDLLLYDSLCWDCTTSGQCKPNSKEQRCFFSSGTSSIQVFRIGRTISTRFSDVDFQVCSLPKDSGSCDNKIFRYYYNAIERRCKLFVYGGCKGNENNFLTETQCIEKCGDEEAKAQLPPQVEVTTEIDTCSQPRDEGICPGNVPRFYFDKELARCQLFSYGGCGGNSNNFQNQDECVAHCGGPKDSIVHQGLKAILKPRKSFCNLLLDKGNCQATLRRFYFDRDAGVCRLFIFGGCQGNANNFETMEDCLLNCAGPEVEGHEDEVFERATPRFIAVATTHAPRKRPDIRKNHLIGNVHALHVSSPLAPAQNNLTGSVCHLSKHFGSCLTISTRFYYDSATAMCRKFRYSGCGGNGNNFLTGEACVKTCGGQVEPDLSSPRTARPVLVAQSLISSDPQPTANSAIPTTSLSSTTVSTSTTTSTNASTSAPSTTTTATTTSAITTTATTSTTTTTVISTTTTATSTTTLATSTSTTTTTSTTSTTTTITMATPTTSSTTSTSPSTTVSSSPITVTSKPTTVTSTPATSSTTAEVTTTNVIEDISPAESNNEEETAVLERGQYAVGDSEDLDEDEDGAVNDVDNHHRLRVRVRQRHRSSSSSSSGKEGTSTATDRPVTSTTPRNTNRSRYRQSKSSTVRSDAPTTTPTTSTTTVDTKDHDPNVRMRMQTQTSRSVVVRTRPKSGRPEDEDHSTVETPEEKSRPRFNLRPPFPRLPSKLDTEDPLRPVEDLDSGLSVARRISTRLFQTSHPTPGIRRQEEAQFSKRSNQQDEDFEATAGPVEASQQKVVRSYCRLPPLESEMASCFRPKPLYFFNVTTASCQPFYKGYCGRSRNRFMSEASCLESCLTTSSGFTTGNADPILGQH